MYVIVSWVCLPIMGSNPFCVREVILSAQLPGSVILMVTQIAFQGACIVINKGKSALMASNSYDHYMCCS